MRRALNLSLNSRCVYLLFVNIPWVGPPSIYCTLIRTISKQNTVLQLFMQNEVVLLVVVRHTIRTISKQNTGVQLFVHNEAKTQDIDDRYQLTPTSTQCLSRRLFNVFNVLLSCSVVNITK